MLLRPIWLLQQKLERSLPWRVVPQYLANKESTKALFDPLYDLRPRQAM